MPSQQPDRTAPDPGYGRLRLKAAQDVLAPEPDRVFSRTDLTRQLDRFRTWDTSGAPRRRVGLTTLARLTGIPRSTLHTYLSGTTLPSADVLDAIVLGLGCSPEQAQAWGEAWERVTDAARGSGSPGRVRHWSKFMALDQEVRSLLDRPTDQLLDLAAPVAITERVVIGASRRMDEVQLRVTLRALADGADRWIVRFPDGDSVGALEGLDVTRTQNCRPGQHRFLAGPRVRVLELLLGHELLAGETQQIEFSVDYAATRTPAAGARSTSPRSTATPCDCVLHGFRRQGPSYVLEVCFQPDQQPDHLRQVHRAAPDGPEDKVRDLRLTPWHTVSIALGQPGAGLHGICWSWPDRSGDGDQHRS